jgi:hypothetical protein
MGGLAPAHSHAQALAVSAAVRAVLKPLYPPLLNRENYTMYTVGADRLAILYAAMRAVHLTGPLAHSATLRHVLAHIAATASDYGQVGFASIKLYYDLKSGDATGAQADFATAMNAEHAGDVELRAIAPYVGKL